jgi:hypothetical protein
MIKSIDPNWDVRGSSVHLKAIPSSVGGLVKWRSTVKSTECCLLLGAYSLRLGRYLRNEVQSAEPCSSFPSLLSPPLHPTSLKYYFCLSVTFDRASVSEL